MTETEKEGKQRLPRRRRERRDSLGEGGNQKLFLEKKGKQRDPWICCDLIIPLLCDYVLYLVPSKVLLYYFPYASNLY